MLTFDSEVLIQYLRNISNQKRLAFLLLLCERQIPLLRLFAENTEYDIHLYLNCLDKAWIAVRNSDILIQDIDSCRLEKNCLALAPDTEKFSNVLTSFALNCALSIGGTMKFIYDRNLDGILKCCLLAYETVDMYVQMTDILTHEKVIDEGQGISHPLVQAELVRQLDDLRSFDEMQYIDVENLLSIAKSQPSIIPLDKALMFSPPDRSFT